MQEYIYSGWKINSHTNEATRLISPDTEVVKVSLKTGDIVPFEGWWPAAPTKDKSVMISGICLWDARWQVEFEQINKNNPAACRSIALPIERKKAMDKIKSGDKVTKIHYPLSLSAYHQTLITWQLKKIQQFKPKRVLYHLPIEEYHEYINDLETVLNISLFLLHEKLNLFIQALTSYMKNVFDESVMQKIEFISPYKQGAANALDSYIFPYQYPEKFNVDPEEIFGVEDFIEIRLAYAASKQRGGNPIHVLGGMIGLQSPYYYEKKLIDTEFIEIKEHNVKNSEQDKGVIPCATRDLLEVV